MSSLLGLHEHAKNAHAILEIAGNFAVTFVALLVFSVISTVPQNRLPTTVELFWCLMLSLGEAFSMYGINSKIAKKEGS